MDIAGFLHKVLDAQLCVCNIENTNIVNELKDKTKEVGKKIAELKNTHIFCDYVLLSFVFL